MYYSIIEIKLSSKFYIIINYKNDSLILLNLNFDYDNQNVRKVCLTFNENYFYFF